MIKKLYTLLLLLAVVAVPVVAQHDTCDKDVSFAPKKGQWQVSVVLGNGQFYNERNSYLLPNFTNTEGAVGLPNGGTNSSGNLNPYLNISGFNNNSIVNLAGVQGCDTDCKFVSARG